MIPPGKTHSVRLCPTFVRTVNVPGRYGDGYGGHGLSLLATPRKSGGFSKTWAQAISPNGAKTSLGLGAYPVVTLAMAREKALAIARAIAEGRDPRRRMQKVPTFAQANVTVVAIHAEHWKSERSESQWHASMRDHVLLCLARARRRRAIGEWRGWRRRAPRCARARRRARGGCRRDRAWVVTSLVVRARGRPGPGRGAPFGRREGEDNAPGVRKRRNPDETSPNANTLRTDNRVAFGYGEQVRPTVTRGRVRRRCARPGHGMNVATGQHVSGAIESRAEPFLCPHAGPPAPPPRAPRG